MQALSEISLEDVEEARLELSEKANRGPFSDPGSIYGLIAIQIGHENTWQTRKRILDILKRKVRQPMEYLAKGTTRRKSFLNRSFYRFKKSQDNKDNLSAPAALESFNNPSYNNLNITPSCNQGW